MNTIFKNDPVSSYLLDPIRSVFIAESEHITDGYRQVADVSYPCFTSQGGQRIELREGVWNGNGNDANLKLVNLPVFKHHSGTGITGVLNFINANGGIGGEDVHMGDENIEVFAASGAAPPSGNSDTGDSGGGGCFITTATS